MALGQVNTPGAAGVDATIARQVAQQAKEQADAALLAAQEAGSAAGAAMEKAADAESAAGDANTKAEAAQEAANALAASVQAASETANSALSTANAAKNTADDAAAAAAKAQETADAVSQALTDMNSTISTVPSQNGKLPYNGSEQSPAWNGYDPEKMTIDGTLSATNVGTYTATVTPNEGYKWSDGTSDAKEITWSISKASIEVPTVSSNPTYTGSAVSPTLSGYDSAKMTLGGTTSATNAGSYSLTVTPGANYQWSDGTETAKTVAWSIGKAAGSLALAATSVALDISNLTKTVAVTRAGNGTISATSSNTSVAKVEVSGTNVIITGLAAGDATITVKVAAGTNHTAPANKTIAVSVSVPSSTLASNTPDIIQAAAQSGQAANYWSVGDKVGIAVNGTFGGLTYNSTVYAFILGFNHNSAVEGGNSIHFQFGKTSGGVDIAWVNSYGSTGTGFCMNTSNTNSGGWKSSYMRQTICPAFLSALPTAWQNVIAACTKYSDNTGGGSNTASYVTSTSDKIWLLAECEVFGSGYGYSGSGYANDAEKNYQKQYDYYANGNSKVKYQHSATTTACRWWLRSVYANDSYNFCSVDTSGGANHYRAYYSRGFAPGFKVA